MLGDGEKPRFDKNFRVTGKPEESVTWGAAQVRLGSPAASRPEEPERRGGPRHLLGDAQDVDAQQ